MKRLIIFLAALVLALSGYAQQDVNAGISQLDQEIANLKARIASLEKEIQEVKAMRMEAPEAAINDTMPEDEKKRRMQYRETKGNVFDGVQSATLKALTDQLNALRSQLGEKQRNHDYLVIKKGNDKKALEAKLAAQRKSKQERLRKLEKDKKNKAAQEEAARLRREQEDRAEQIRKKQQEYLEGKRVERGQKARAQAEKDNAPNVARQNRRLEAAANAAANAGGRSVEMLREQTGDIMTVPADIPSNSELEMPKEDIASLGNLLNEGFELTPEMQKEDELALKRIEAEIEFEEELKEVSEEYVKKWEQKF